MTGATVIQTTTSSPALPAQRNYVMRGPAAEKALDLYHLIFAPTHACNLRCRHCYLPDHSGVLIPFDQVRILIERWERIVLRDRGPLGGYFHLKGGEPLIVPYLADILELLATRASLRFMMTTNGTLLSAWLRRALRRLDDQIGNKALIIVSLDGSNEDTNRLLRGAGNFAKTLRFARTLVDDGLNVHFNYVVHSENLGDVPAFLELAENVGVAQINFLPMVPKGFGASMGEHGRPDPRVLHEMLLKLYKSGCPGRQRLLAGNYADILAAERRGVETSHECVAGYRGLFYITPEGDVYTCPNLVQAGLKLGNYLETDLIEIHDRRIAELYRSRLHVPGLDERYLCRGERIGPATSRMNDASEAPSHFPIIGQTAITTDAYPPPARALQSTLLRDGHATETPERGVSYCFSRNF